MKNNNTITDNRKIAIIGSIIIVIIIVSVGAISFFIGKKNAEETASPIPAIDLSSQSAKRVLGAQIFNWSGTIINVQIDKSKIVFQSQSRDKTGALQTKEISAVIEPSTQLLKWDLTKPPTNQTDSNRQPIALSQFKPGQQITVQSYNDINDKNEIIATSVNLLITPATL